MTVVDHPLRQFAELNLRIDAEITAWPCWKTDLLWNAYLTLEFGPRQTLIGKDGPVAMGMFRMLLEEAPWWIERDGQEVLDGEDVLESLDRSVLDEIIIGKQLLRLDWREHLSAAFSEGITLNFEQPEGGREQLLELRFPNGDCADLYSDRAVEIESMAE
jgi:hypothetical protein